MMDPAGNNETSNISFKADVETEIGDGRVDARHQALIRTAQLALTKNVGRSRWRAYCESIGVQDADPSEHTVLILCGFLNSFTADLDEGRHVFAYDLPAGASQNEVHRAFSHFGEICECIVESRQSGMRIARATFVDTSAAERCVDGRISLSGKRVRCVLKTGPRRGRVGVDVRHADTEMRGGYRCEFGGSSGHSFDGPFSNTSNVALPDNIPVSAKERREMQRSAEQAAQRAHEAKIAADLRAGKLGSQIADLEAELQQLRRTHARALNESRELGEEEIRHLHRAREAGAEASDLEQLASERAAERTAYNNCGAAQASSGGAAEAAEEAAPGLQADAPLSRGEAESEQAVPLPSLTPFEVKTFCSDMPDHISCDMEERTASCSIDELSEAKTEASKLSAEALGPWYEARAQELAASVGASGADWLNDDARAYAAQLAASRLSLLEAEVAPKVQRTHMLHQMLSAKIKGRSLAKQAESQRRELFSPEPERPRSPSRSPSLVLTVDGQSDEPS